MAPFRGGSLGARSARGTRSTERLFDYDVTGLSLPNALHVSHRVPVEGEYLFRVVLSGARPAGSEPLEVGLWVDGRQVEVFTDPTPDGGFVVMRSGRNGSSHALIFDTGPLGCPITSGHGHADLLSIQCSVFGEPCIVDPGMSGYAAHRDWREFFRSDASSC